MDIPIVITCWRDLNRTDSHKFEKITTLPNYSLSFNMSTKKDMRRIDLGV